MSEVLALMDRRDALWGEIDAWRQRDPRLQRFHPSINSRVEAEAALNEYRSIEIKLRNITR